MTRTYWTDDQVAILRELYPDHRTAAVAEVLGRCEKSTYAKANQLGLKKSAAFFASAKSGRMQRGKKDPRMTASQFKPGMVPWNKGMKGIDIGGKHTRFKTRAPEESRNYKPIGSLRITRDGILERKVTDDRALVPARRWTAVHRLVWEAAHGPIPPKHIVIFKPGTRTTVEAEITVDRLLCITRKELADRNGPRSKHPELVKLYQLKGAITRQVNRIQREANEQHQRTA